MNYRELVWAWRTVRVSGELPGVEGTSSHKQIVLWHRNNSISPSLSLSLSIFPLTSMDCEFFLRGEITTQEPDVNQTRAGRQTFHI